MKSGNVNTTLAFAVTTRSFAVYPCSAPFAPTRIRADCSTISVMSCSLPALRYLITEGFPVIQQLSRECQETGGEKRVPGNVVWQGEQNVSAAAQSFYRIASFDPFEPTLCQHAAAQPSGF